MTKKAALKTLRKLNNTMVMHKLGVKQANLSTLKLWKKATSVALAN